LPCESNQEPTGEALLLSKRISGPLKLAAVLDTLLAPGIFHEDALHGFGYSGPATFRCRLVRRSLGALNKTALKTSVDDYSRLAWKKP